MSQNIFNKKVVLDGALGTALEDLIDPSAPYLPSKSPLWSGQVLLDAPELIQKVHEMYIGAGSEVIFTSTYQLSYDSLRKHTTLSDEQILEVWQRSIDLVRAAAPSIDETARYTKEKESRGEPGKVHIAGSIGPYAAYLANGSEYTGDYGNVTDEQLEAFHTPMLEFFTENEAVDLIAFETIPNFQELKAVTKLMKRLNCKKPVLFSITCQNLDNLTDGTPLLEVKKYLDFCLPKEQKILGINCVEYTLVQGIMSHFAGFKFYVYPNLGFEYDLEKHQFVIKEGRSEDDWRLFVENLASKEAVIGIGGCCNTGVKEIEQISQVMYKE